MRINLESLPRTLRRDLIVAGIFLVGGFFTGLIYMTTAGTPNFYAEQHGPAVMLALGKGYFNPDPSQVPALEDFLQQRVDVLDVAALPEVIPLRDSYDPMQRLYRYGQYLVGGVWRIFGVSWAALTILFGGLFGLSAALLYGVFRLGMGRLLSTGLGALAITAPLHLSMLPLLRDYGKVPFLLAGFLLLGCLVKWTLKGWAVLLVGMLFGALCGIGLGFRDDVLMMLPVFVITVVFFLPGGLKARWPVKIGAIVLLGITFYGCAYPILQERKEIGACEGDHVYLGLLDRCSERLGVGGAAYSFGGPYSDNYVKGVIHSYGHRVEGLDETPDWYTPAYDELGVDLIRGLLFTFPADFVTRAYASVLRLLDGMHPSRTHPAPDGLNYPYWQKLFGVHVSLLLALGFYTRYQALLLVALLSARNLRLGLFVLFLGLYFLGINAIQFNLRHHIHLLFVPLWISGCLLQHGVSATQAGWTAYRAGSLTFSAVRPTKAWWPTLLHALCPVLIIVLAMPMALYALRLYQGFPVRNLLRSYADAELEALAYHATPTGSGSVRLEVPIFAQMETLPTTEKGWRVHAEMLVAEFRVQDDEIPLTLRYRPEIPGVDYPGNDFTYTSAIPSAGLASGQKNATQKSYFPVYFAPWSEFVGVEMAEADVPKLVGLYRWRDREQLPDFLLFAHVGSDGETVSTYQRLEDH